VPSAILAIRKKGKRERSRKNKEKPRVTFSQRRAIPNLSTKGRDEGGKEERNDGRKRRIGQEGGSCAQVIIKYGVRIKTKSRGQIDFIIKICLCHNKNSGKSVAGYRGSEEKESHLSSETVRSKYKCGKRRELAIIEWKVKGGTKN